MNNYIWSGMKVRLRPIQSTDWAKFHNNDLDSEVARLCDVIHFPRSEEGTKSWAMHQESNYTNGDNISLAIENHEGILVGSISANNCDSHNGTFRYGIAIFREQWRKGYAADAVKILIRYYLEELRYRKVNAHVYAFNEGSVSLQEHLGFVQEGRIRDMIFTKGQHFDEFIYGLTINEYEKLKCKPKID